MQINVYATRIIIAKIFKLNSIISVLVTEKVNINILTAGYVIYCMEFYTVYFTIYIDQVFIQAILVSVIRHKKLNLTIEF